MGEVLDRLDEVIDELLTLDLETLDDDEVNEVVVGVQRRCHRLAAARARLLSRWDRSGGWTADGSRSAASRLARDTRTSVSSAKVELRRARHLESMPHRGGTGRRRVECGSRRPAGPGERRPPGRAVRRA